MKVPLYIPKWVEEIARVVGGAEFIGVVAFVADKGVPNDSTGWIALAAAVAPLAWAAFRTVLNKTPITPSETPVVPPPGPTP